MMTWCRLRPRKRALRNITRFSQRQANNETEASSQKESDSPLGIPSHSKTWASAAWVSVQRPTARITSMRSSHQRASLLEP